jgi:hypothetical protein
MRRPSTYFISIRKSPHKNQHSPKLFPVSGGFGGRFNFFVVSSFPIILSGLSNTTFQNMGAFWGGATYLVRFCEYPKLCPPWAMAQEFILPLPGFLFPSSSYVWSSSRICMERMDVASLQFLCLGATEEGLWTLSCWISFVAFCFWCWWQRWRALLSVYELPV